MSIVLPRTKQSYRRPAAAEFTCYREFWPYYVAMHGRRLTRRIHLAGTALGLLTALTGAVTGRPRLILAFPMIGYGFAWPAHWFVEGNNPATFGHPLWSLRGDFVMTVLQLSGRDDELAGTARVWQAANRPMAGA
jgi:hypothetical protein